MNKFNDILKFKYGDIVIAIINSKNYVGFVLKLFKEHSSGSRKLVFVSATKSHSYFVDLLKKYKVDYNNLCFIDTISKLGGDTINAKSKVIYVNHPSDLTEISINIAGCLKSTKNNFVVIDSLSTLSLYNSTNDLVKFVHLLSQKNKKSKAATILLAIKEELDESFIKKLSGYCDSVVDLSDGKGNHFVEP